VYASCGKEHFNLHPQKDGYFYFKHYLSFSVEKELLFFSLKVESKATCLILHFFFSHDRSDCQQNSSVSVLQKAKQKLEEMGIDAYTII
jgi:hypothetical protein